MNETEWIGWVSSIVLVFTIGKQVSKQWRTQSFKGVSKWLYSGQLAAESGFVLYSVLLRSWVFVATNSALLLLNLVGLVLYLRVKHWDGTPRTP